MAQQFSNVLSNEIIDYILSCPEVINAKNRIESRNLTATSEYFILPLTDTIRSALVDQFGIEFSQSSIPMRWVLGDTPSHDDHSISDFANTYLVYLTDSNGHLVIEGVQYPIQRGYGYVFPEGLSHETIGTLSEPRLLLGPMSESGIVVGASSYYQYPGGTNVYIRQTSPGEPITFSTDMSEWYSVYWPITFENINTSLGFLNINFITDIILDSANTYGVGYFICASEYIQFGSNILESDPTNITLNARTRPVITIDGISNYPGLIQNGTNWSNGYDNILVTNLVMETSGGATLANSAGWFGQAYFGKNTTSLTNIVLNCRSTGNISEAGGGIIGQYSGPVKAVNCCSSGQIDVYAGGIFGADCPTSGALRCDSCWSSGSIGLYGGGITGQSTRAATIINCYSTGNIDANAGGISGRYTGDNYGNYIVSECYTTGSINIRGGGIVGSDTYLIYISNCYSTGYVEAGAGGILGTVPSGNDTNKYITNCYKTGAVGASSSPYGFLVVNRNEETGSFTIGTGDIILTNNYAEAAHANTGWSNSRANTILQGVPSSSPIGAKWVYAGIETPYELFAMGFTPYSKTNISSSPFSMIRTFSSSVFSGLSTSPALIGLMNYTKLRITGGFQESYNTITIDRNTGVINTSRTTMPGTYTLDIRNNNPNGGYNITTYVITVVQYVALRNLFSNNAQVYYKPHSLASCGVGTVRNSRLKARKT